MKESSRSWACSLIAILSSSSIACSSSPTIASLCLKNVTINEPFFQGHFPGVPVMPGVLQIEAMAQAGGILASRAVSV